MIDDDVSATTLLPDGELKMLSENKSLQANPKNAQTFKFESCIIPILSANNFPMTKDLSDGLRRRAQVFLFRRQFATHEQDGDLSDFMINNEISGVLNILLEGLRRVRARGRWDEPKDCLEARNQLYASNNTIVDFIAYGLVKTRPENVALYEDVWRVYQTYTIEEGIRRPLSRARLRDQLTAAGVKIIERHGRLHIVGYRPKNLTHKN